MMPARISSPSQPSAMRAPSTGALNGLGARFPAIGRLVGVTPGRPRAHVRRLHPGRRHRPGHRLPDSGCKGVRQWKVQWLLLTSVADRPRGSSGRGRGTRLVRPAPGPPGALSPWRSLSSSSPSASPPPLRLRLVGPGLVPALRVPRVDPADRRPGPAVTSLGLVMILLALALVPLVLIRRLGRERGRTARTPRWCSLRPSWSIFAFSTWRSSASPSKYIPLYFMMDATASVTKAARHEAA